MGGKLGDLDSYEIEGDETKYEVLQNFSEFHIVCVCILMLEKLSLLHLKGVRDVLKIKDVVEFNDKLCSVRGAIVVDVLEKVNFKYTENKFFSILRIHYALRYRKLFG